MACKSNGCQVGYGNGLVFVRNTWRGRPAHLSARAASLRTNRLFCSEVLPVLQGEINFFLDYNRHLSNVNKNTKALVDFTIARYMKHVTFEYYGWATYPYVVGAFKEETITLLRHLDFGTTLLKLGLVFFEHNSSSASTRPSQRCSR